MKSLVFCIIVDIAIITAMVLIAFFTKSLFSLLLVFALIKPEYKYIKEREEKNEP